MATEVTIKIRAFPYYVEQEDPVTGNTVRVERVAYRGDTVELSDTDLARAKQYDAIGDPDSSGGDTASDDDSGFDPALASVEELAEWIEEDKPTVNDVIEAAGGDPQVASRLLDAENLATGNQPRAGVVEGLSKVAGRS